MPIRERPGDVGRAAARRQTQTLLVDIDQARRTAALSHVEIARAAAMSPAQVGRLLRGVVGYPTADQLGRLCAAVGLDLVVRAYPGGDPIRDAAQTALLARFANVLPPSLPWRTEVVIGMARDRRAWDGTIGLHPDRVGVEAETRLWDIQATQRRIALKQRDGNIERVILVIADTRANHRAFEAASVALRTQFPLGPRAVLAALRDGRLPEASGYVFI